MITSSESAELLALRAEVAQYKADAERMQWIQHTLNDRGAVWFMPCGEERRFVQIRWILGSFKDDAISNFPVANNLREAIDAAIDAMKDGK